MICDMSGWELATPETRDTFESLMFWIEKHGLIAVADISSGLFKNSAKDFIQELSDDLNNEENVNIKARDFLTVNEGIDWLKEQGFSMEDEVDT